MPLNPNDQHTIASLSRVNVQRTLAGLRPYFSSRGWIGPRNQYRSKTIEKTEKEGDAGRAARPKQLSQYIAASSLLHCTDGWSYLGRSLQSLLRGDPHRARHLGYYAELRAAMSLLASSGIGVFNNRHFAINSVNSVVVLERRLGTHRFVWECFEFWANNHSQTADLFSSVISPYGRELDDWLQPIGGVRALAPVAGNWLKLWGFDLKLPPADRDARNESSYRPDGVNGTWKLKANKILDFVMEFWSSLEPSINSQFDEVDRHLLRLAVERAFFAQNGTVARSSSPAYKNYVQSVLDHAALSPDLAKELRRFMLRQILPRDLPLLQYANVSPQTNDNGGLGVIARATLMLRMASGSNAQLFKGSGFPRGICDFWWRDLVVNRGLSDTNLSADQLGELWEPVKLYLEHIQAYRRRPAGVGQNFYQLDKELGQGIGTLGSCERVALWAMMPALT